ncbi:hypothetical protein ACCAA_180014 [Candidatus Accumulibacter aalborgensis]|uniref:Uncharacterized protein n=1 Tax=Candidatus Accumulibacter aalborgensis TaxID=1860102 RepID=A0A1A8XHT6_9PROT|nr:hypothetical protein ACCAA_180014 [Candidatus Accumulibacter aalborgensis]
MMPARRQGGNVFVVTTTAWSRNGRPVPAPTDQAIPLVDDYREHRVGVRVDSCSVKMHSTLIGYGGEMDSKLSVWLRGLVVFSALLVAACAG